MFVYDKKLQYPVKIAAVNPRLAAIIISQYGGPDGELGASLRYLSQRYAMPFDELKGLLTDIGTEELGHAESEGFSDEGFGVCALFCGPHCGGLPYCRFRISVERRVHGGERRPHGRPCGGHGSGTEGAGDL